MGQSWTEKDSASDHNKPTPWRPATVGGSWDSAIADLMPKGALPKSRNYGDNAIVIAKCSSSGLSDSSLDTRKTGLRQGLVVTAMGVHRFHGLDVNLGSEFDQLWVKSLPDRPHDRAIVQSYFDHLPR